MTDDPRDFHMLRRGIKELARVGAPMGEVMDTLQRVYVQAAVDECNGNRCKAARHIKTHRNTILRHLGPRQKRKPPAPVSAVQVKAVSA